MFEGTGGQVHRPESTEQVIEAITALNANGRTACRITKNCICGGHYSTIYSAKGLEATSALMLANTSTMLEKWLETDSEKLRTKDDSYRI